jgi:hypothetical protein
LWNISLFQKKRLPDVLPNHPDRIETIVEAALLKEFLMSATLCEAALLSAPAGGYALLCGLEISRAQRACRAR